MKFKFNNGEELEGNVLAKSELCYIVRIENKLYLLNRAELVDFKDFKDDNRSL